MPSRNFDEKLGDYSSAAKVATLALAAAGTTSAAHAQLTAIHLSASATVSSHVGANGPGTANGSAGFSFGSARGALHVNQGNFDSNGGSAAAARGTAFIAPISPQGFHLLMQNVRTITTYNHVGSAIKLARGALVQAGAGQVFSHVNGRLFETQSVIGNAGGENQYNIGVATGINNFAPAGHGQHRTGYVGFRFGSDSVHFHYGWLKVSVSEDANGRPASISLVAADGNGDVGAFGALGQSVAAGSFTGSTVPAVPEPAAVAAGLGLLALGVTGVRELRRRRKVVA